MLIKSDCQTLDKTRRKLTKSLSEQQDVSRNGPGDSSHHPGADHGPCLQNVSVREGTSGVVPVLPHVLDVVINPVTAAAASRLRCVVSAHVLYHQKSRSTVEEKPL